MRLSATRRGTISTGRGLGDHLYDLAGAPPSLDLRFADQKVLDSRISFTRASTATYVGSDGLIKSAAVNEPRFDHNPVTGESLGLLVGEARTNLALRSEEFDDAAWGKSLSTVSANATTSPDGSASADKWIPDNGAAAGGAGILQNVAVSASATYAQSIYVKAAGMTSLRFQMGIRNPAFLGSSQATFNITAGTFGTVANSGTPATGVVFSAQLLVGGWYRIIVTGTTPATTTAIRFQILSDVIGDGANGIHFWGAQLEEGSFATSYIPTTTASATRSADVAQITGTNFSSWYRQDEGTMFSQFTLTQTASGGNQFIFRANDNSFNNNTTINIQSGGLASIATAAGGVSDGDAASALALSANTAAKFAGAYAANNLGVSLNGATTATDTSATMPTALNRLDIGSDHSGINRIKAGTIKRLTYWPNRLPNSPLQSLTS